MINYSGKKYVVTFLAQRNMDLKLFFLIFRIKTNKIVKNILIKHFKPGVRTPLLAVQMDF